MKTLTGRLLNVFKAPKSTVVALGLLLFLTWLQHTKVIEKDTYGVAIAIVIPLIFTDIMSENKRKKADEGY